VEFIPGTQVRDFPGAVKPRLLQSPHRKMAFLHCWICLSLLLLLYGSVQAAEVLVGAGDIASCEDLAGARNTANLLEAIPGTVFAAGDLAYGDGSREEFADCYGPTWGSIKMRTRPAPGNHEYHTAHAAAYSSTSDHVQVTRTAATIVTNWAAGTSWSSTATARRLAAATLGHLRSAGFAETSLNTRQHVR
jgi:hypothetical protein